MTTRKQRGATTRSPDPTRPELRYEVPAAKEGPTYPLVSRDWQQPENEGLHQLYVSQAVDHLRAVRRAQDELAGFSNLNLMDMQQAMEHEAQKLVLQNPAYRDAAALLWAGIRPKQG